MRGEGVCVQAQKVYNCFYNHHSDFFFFLFSYLQSYFHLHSYRQSKDETLSPSKYHLRMSDLALNHFLSVSNDHFGIAPCSHPYYSQCARCQVDLSLKTKPKREYEFRALQVISQRRKSCSQMFFPTLKCCCFSVRSAQTVCEAVTRRGAESQRMKMFFTQSITASLSPSPQAQPWDAAAMETSLLTEEG